MIRQTPGHGVVVFKLNLLVCLNGFRLFVVAIAAACQKHCSQLISLLNISLSKKSSLLFRCQEGAAVFRPLRRPSPLLTLVIKNKAV